jgi:alpha-aminoadipate carrier protein LysW
MVNCKCPECDGEVDIPDDALDGEIVSCPDCGEEFEVSFNDKKDIILKKAEVVAEDWGE